jgi:hypothetical protein
LAELAGDIDCDCVPYELYWFEEVVYWPGPIEGAGMANSVAIVLIEI